MLYSSIFWVVMESARDSDLRAACRWGVAGARGTAKCRLVAAGQELVVGMACKHSLPLAFLGTAEGLCVF